MKSTTVTARIKIDAEGASECYSQLRGKIGSIPGVTGIADKIDFDGTWVDMSIQIDFGDSEAAEKIIGRILSSIKKNAGVDIRSMSYGISEIYG